MNIGYSNKKNTLWLRNTFLDNFLTTITDRIYYIRYGIITVFFFITLIFAPQKAFSDSIITNADYSIENSGFMFAQEMKQNSGQKINGIKAGKIIIEGNKSYTKKFILKHFSSSIENGYIREDSFNKAIAFLNETTGLKVTPVLSPGEKEGTTDILLRVKDRKPLNFNLEANNYGNPGFAENRIVLNAAFGNLTKQGDTFTYKDLYTFNQTRQHNYIYLYYTRPINNHGTIMKLNYSNFDKQISEDPSESYLRGNTDVYSIDFQTPLKRDSDVKSNLTYGFTMKNVKDFQTIPSIKDIPKLTQKELESLYSYFNLPHDILVLTYYLINSRHIRPYSEDRIRSINIGYNLSKTYYSGKLTASVILTQALGSFLGGTTVNNPNAKRIFSGNEFTKLNIDISDTIKTGGNNSFFLKGLGQLANNRLISTEQLVLGGIDSVRGYSKGEYRGDNGFSINAEYHMALSMFKRKSGNSIDGYLFFDYGFASLKNPTRMETPDKTLMGAGFGFKTDVSENSAMKFDVGWPMNPPKNKYNRNPFIYGMFSLKF